MIFAYCDVLLLLIRRETSHAQVLGRPVDMGLVGGYCDRFERALAAVSKPTLVWQGDYA